MSEMVPVWRYELEIPKRLVGPIQEEFERRHSKARRCFGKAIRNAALGFLELYRIKQKELWRAGFNNEGHPYETWEQYLAEFVFEVTSVSRSTVYGRMRMIQRLQIGLGWGFFIIFRALQSPAAVQDALNKLAVWKRGTGEFQALRPGVEERLALPFTEDTAQGLLSRVVSNVMALPRGEGRKHVSELAGELQIWGRVKVTQGRLFIIIRNEEQDKEYQYGGPEPDEDTLAWLERKFGQPQESS